MHNLYAGLYTGHLVGFRKFEVSRAGTSRGKAANSWAESAHFSVLCSWVGRRRASSSQRAADWRPTTKWAISGYSQGVFGYAYGILVVYIDALPPQQSQPLAWRKLQL